MSFHDDERNGEDEEIVKHSEGAVARTIEDQTARMPSDVFLWSALAAGGAAAYLFATRRSRLAVGVAQLAPCFLIMGLYNKIVKVAGSDRLVSQGALGDVVRPLLH